jgi:hypothetical protein
MSSSVRLAPLTLPVPSQGALPRIWSWKRCQGLELGPCPLPSVCLGSWSAHHAPFIMDLRCCEGEGLAAWAALAVEEADGEASGSRSRSLSSSLLLMAAAPFTASPRGWLA